MKEITSEISLKFGGVRRKVGTFSGSGILGQLHKLSMKVIGPITELTFLPGDSGNLSENQVIAAQIDAYINNPQTRSPRVHQQDKTAFLLILVGLGCVGFGLFGTWLNLCDRCQTFYTT